MYKIFSSYLKINNDLIILNRVANTLNSLLINWMKYFKKNYIMNEK